MFELGREMTRFEGEMWENELIDTTMYCKHSLKYKVTNSPFSYKIPKWFKFFYEV